MAHVWHFDGSSWMRHPLAGNYFRLGVNSVLPVEPAPVLPVDRTSAVVGRYEDAARSPQWVLLGNETCGVRINGQSLLAGLSVLRDRDEILIGGRSRLYFSTEQLAKVEPFPGGDDPAFCARCRQPIQPGAPAVRCPFCGHWCEQSEAKPCWTYGPTCPLCEQLTAFDAGLRWTPNEM